MPDADVSGFRDLIRDARKILVVDLGFLGDTIHLIPALQEIKRHHPSAELHVLSAPLGVEILKLAPCVDKPWTMELDPSRRTIAGQWNLIRSLRGRHFDAAFNFSGADRANIITALSGARHKLAHAAGRNHFYNHWIISNWVSRRPPNLPVFEQRRQILAACGYDLAAPEFGLKLDHPSRQWADRTVPARAIHLSVNSAKALKEWPIENYATWLELLWKRLPEQMVVASASPKSREQERLKHLRSLVPDQRLQLLPASLTIAQLAAALQRCRLHLGPDSGVIHLAVALGIPAVTLIRDQPGHECWLPPGNANEALLAPCKCADRCVLPGGSEERAQCLANISPETALEAVMRLINETN